MGHQFPISLAVVIQSDLKNIYSHFLLKISHLVAFAMFVWIKLKWFELNPATLDESSDYFSKFHVGWWLNLANLEIYICISNQANGIEVILIKYGNAAWVIGYVRHQQTNSKNVWINLISIFFNLEISVRIAMEIQVILFQAGNAGWVIACDRHPTNQFQETFKLIWYKLSLI